MMPAQLKPIYFLGGRIKTPPFSEAARKEAGRLLFELQRGHSLGMPKSKPLPLLGSRSHELRVRDVGHNWRIVYRIDPKVILVFSIFSKTGRAHQQREFAEVKRRMKRYDEDHE